MIDELIKLSERLEECRIYCVKLVEEYYDIGRVNMANFNKGQARGYKQSKKMIDKIIEQMKKAP